LSKIAGADLHNVTRGIPILNTKDVINFRANAQLQKSAKDENEHRLRDPLDRMVAKRYVLRPDGTCQGPLSRQGAVGCKARELW
jgi:hypothetical protein